MAQDTGIFRRRGPALLLLGLLALLLWGQCASLLYPNREPDLFSWVGSTDSLHTAPATLYLSLHLRNTLHHPVAVQVVEGSLLFNGRAHPFSATAALQHIPLPHNARAVQTIAIPLHLPADSLALLRATLTAEHPTSRPRLSWRLGYLDERFPTDHYWGQASGLLPQLKPRP